MATEITPQNRRETFLAIIGGTSTELPPPPYSRLEQLYLSIIEARGEAYTAEEKNKLAGVEEGAQVNILEGVQVNGTALAIAQKVVNLLIAAGTTNGTIAVNGVDVAVTGLAALAYKSEVSASDLASALLAAINGKAEASTVNTLIGSDTNKSVRTIAVEELAAQLIPTTAQEALDTLQEVAAWIQSHPAEAAAINAKLTLGTHDVSGQQVQYATVKDYVEAVVAGLNHPDPATAVSPMDSASGAVGTSASYARQDHVHPTDTSRASAADMTAVKNLLNDLTLYKSISGSPAVISDALAAPVHDLHVTIAPVQAGSGDPSPSNIRAISGWTGANITRTGANIWGGIKMAQDIAGIVPGAILDTGTHTIRYTGSSANGRILFDKFSPNTQYTVLLYGHSDDGLGRVNMLVLYADDTLDYLPNVGVSGLDAAARFVTAEGKTVKRIQGIFSSGPVTLDYTQCGLFEGVVQSSAFEPYIGQSVPITFPVAAGTVYGGTLDAAKGVLTVDRMGIDLGTLTWGLHSGIFVSRALTYDAAPGPNNNADILCSKYKPKAASTWQFTENGCVQLANGVSSPGKYSVTLRDDSYSDTTSFTEAAQGTILVYRLATPITYALTPAQVSTSAGVNQIYASTGPVKVEYRVNTSEILS